MSPRPIQERSRPRAQAGAIPTRRLCRARTSVFEIDVAPGLPAVRSSADAVQQALMQVLSIACDALVLQGDARAMLRVALEQTGATLEVALAFPARLDFSREEVQRTVMLGRVALAPLAAQLAFGQDEAGGSRIKLILPLDSDDKTD